jgi:Winged helix-turn helix
VDERAMLATGLRSSAAFTIRRGHLLLASAEGQHTTPMAQTLRCHDQTVRQAMHAFNQRGVAALQPQSSRPHRTPAVFAADGRARLRALWQQHPRPLGKATSRWPLALAAEVSCAQGLPPRQVSGETLRHALKPRGVRWQRAQHGLTSPDPASVRKKTGAIA